jgi:hypothetical protein
MFDAFFQLPTYLLFVIIFFVIITCNGLGYRYKKKILAKHPDRLHESMGSVEGSILGVTSLLLGFSFSVAVAKYEARRSMTVAEANDIGTAILRCDLYPDSIRSPLRADFKEYVETRIAYYQAGYNEEMIQEELKKAEEISGRIWKRVALYSSDNNFRVSSLQMIPNLNEMIDIVTTRDAQRMSRVPPLVLWTLLIFVFTAAFLLGSDYKGHKRNIMLLAAYALVMTLTLNLINELNHPRQGLINLNQVEKKIEGLRKLLE